ncbi:NRAMP family divalent metal transporter [Andreprevotia chitinilytica]|uniref:NRAMP family divalent metal transporter n=1 Tax=Andreprevotia chitinilytica TaxID=396808 RepID=UPI000550416C|nr:divalent metal cation transporter [Andreprevotia chitinilytica]
MNPGVRNGARWRRILGALGPGLVVMLADTEAGSVIAAAQGGAQWGYRLLVFQLMLIPLLFIAQELSVRLGLGTGLGYIELILQRYGKRFAGVIMAALVLSCFGALVTEMSGLAGVGQLFGVPLWQSMTLLVVAIFLMVITGSYHSIERLAIGLGLFEIAFFVVAWKAAPDHHLILDHLTQQPLRDRGYLYLLAANLGTCVMPWTVAYQQSAIIDKGLTLKELKIARLDTALGAVFCQLVTCAVVIAGATLYSTGGAGGLNSVPDIASAFTHAFGDTVGRVVFALGLSGGALVAIIVVCLTAAWTIGEATGMRHALEKHPKDAPWFYGTFVLMLVAGGVLVASGINLVRLSIAIAVVNAILLPLTLGCLFCLARSALPAEHRLRGRYAAWVAALFIAVGALGLVSGIVGGLG